MLYFVSDFDRKNFGLWAKSMAQGCQSCFLRVQKNFLRETFRKKKYRSIFRLRAKIIWTLFKKLSTGLSNLHFKFAENRFEKDKYFEILVHFFQELIKKAFKLWAKKILARLSLLHASCKEEYFEKNRCLKNVIPRFKFRAENIRTLGKKHGPGLCKLHSTFTEEGFERNNSSE